SLVRDFDNDTFVRQTVRWLMNARQEGRWGNTQENAWAMESLVAYYKKYEREVPDFTGVVSFGAEELTRDTFKGRSTNAASRSEEHTSELQSRQYLVCRLLLEK